MQKKVGRNGKPLKTVRFPADEKDLVWVHHVQTYKRWNYRQYIYVCSHLSYFDRSDLEGIEDEIEEKYGLEDQNDEDNCRISLFEDADCNINQNANLMNENDQDISKQGQDLNSKNKKISFRFYWNF